MRRYWRKILKKKLLKQFLLFLGKKNKGKKKNQHKLSLVNLALGIVFIVLAVGIFCYSPQYFQTPSKNPIIINPILYAAKLNADTPNRIAIPAIKIDLPVVKAPVVNGYWQLSNTTASYGEGSGYPGIAGNTVIFAHARVGLFYNLKNANIGNIIYVYTKNKKYIYRVTQITAVYPDQTDVIAPTKVDTLTLYTCTGFYDQKRLVVTALPLRKT